MMNDVKVRTRDKIAHCWQDKKVRRFLRQQYDGTNSIGTALNIYDGLTEVASNRGNDEFDASYASIATASGVSKRSVIRFVDDFESLGIIKVERRFEGKKSLPSIFTLLAHDSAPPVTGNESINESNVRKKIEKKYFEKGLEALISFFASFWIEYPSKTDQDIAYKTFRELNPSPETYSCLMETLRHSIATDWEGGKSLNIPTPTRWLLERSWE